MFKKLSNFETVLILLVVGCIVYTYSKDNRLIEGWVESCRSRVNKASRKAYRTCSREMYQCYREANRTRPRNRTEWLAVRDARRACRRGVQECYKPLRSLVKEVQNECEIEERSLRGEHREKMESAWNIYEGRIEER